MFKHTICDPLIEHVIDRGVIPKEAVLPTFQDFPWDEMFAKMGTAKEEDVCFSPSVEFTNVEDGHGVMASLVETDGATVFYLFYKDTADDAVPPYELHDQSAATAVDVLCELIDGRYDLLAKRFK